MIAQLEQIESPFFSDQPEKEYRGVTSAEHRKQFGQFFTPPPIAKMLAGWVIANPQCRTILDPAVGLGIFFRAVLQNDDARTFQMRGYDIDDVVLREGKRVFAESGYSNIQFNLKDYLLDDWNDTYDGIICNPPYFRFQHYGNRLANLQAFQQQLGMKLSGLTNIYTLFMLKSIKQLSPGGRAAYIIPSEFLNADYGVAVKRELLNDGKLRHVIIFDTDENVFENALTTTCVLLFADDAKADSITFTRIERAEEISIISSSLTSQPRTGSVTIAYSDLDAAKKWRSYYQERRNTRHRNLVTLSTFGKVARGIATGCNDYFTFNREKQRRHAIPDVCLEPCITKAIHANSSFLTTERFENLKAAGKNVWLFDGQKSDDTATREYVALGERLGVDRKYLTSHRKPWYALERREPAPILVTVFNRGQLKFVRNEAAARNLTCFHGFYPNILAQPDIDVLMAYFVTKTAGAIFNDERREYGGGLKKFEPNDLNYSYVVDLNAIDDTTKERILHYFTHYRAQAVNGHSSAQPLNQLDSIFANIVHSP